MDSLGINTDALKGQDMVDLKYFSLKLCLKGYSENYPRYSLEILFNMDFQMKWLPTRAAEYL